MSNLYDTPPTIEEIERQIRWEAAAVEMGVKRYRQEQRDANTVADTSAGARLIRETMQSLVPYLTDMQEAIRDKTTNSMGYKPDWWTYICLIEPEKLAYLTLRSVLGERPIGDVVGGRKLSASSRALVSSVETEVAYQDFAAGEREKAREARKMGVAYQNQLKALERRVKNLNARTFKRCMARLERIWKQPWPETERMKFGSAMLKALCDHGAGLFELNLVPLPGGKTEYFIRQTEKAETLMADHDARAEVSRPRNRPMLCHPRPWRWVDEGDGQDSSSVTPQTPSGAPQST